MPLAASMGDPPPTATIATCLGASLRTLETVVETLDVLDADEADEACMVTMASAWADAEEPGAENVRVVTWGCDEDDAVTVMADWPPPRSPTAPAPAAMSSVVGFGWTPANTETAMPARSSGPATAGITGLRASAASVTMSTASAPEARTISGRLPSTPVPKCATGPRGTWKSGISDSMMLAPNDAVTRLLAARRAECAFGSFDSVSK